jgi:hypothetical protein
MPVGLEEGTVVVPSWQVVGQDQCGIVGLLHWVSTFFEQ